MSINEHSKAERVKINVLTTTGQIYEIRCSASLGMGVPPAATLSCDAAWVRLDPPS